MSEEYSSEEEHRLNWKQGRRTHDMSSSSAEEGEAEDTDNSDREEEAD